MKRSFFPWLIVIVVCVVALGFYRGWFTLSTHPDAGNKKVDVNLSMDRDKMERDAEEVKKEASEIVGKVKAKVKDTTSPARPSE